MSSKQTPSPEAAEEAVQVFRQFAWHLAGSLASARDDRPPNGGRAGKPSGKGRR